MFDLTAWTRPAALVGAGTALTILTAGCGAVAGAAAREIVIDVFKQVVVTAGANYLTSIFSPDQSGDKPTVTLSYTNTSGFGTGTSYAVAGAGRITSRNVTIKNATGTIRIADDDNGISVTVADGSSGTVGIQLDSENDSDLGASGAEAQAMTLNGILGWSSRARSRLAGALADLEACSNQADATSRLRDVESSRSQQLGSLRHLEVSALPGGESLRDTLVRALTYSFQADQAFVAWGDAGCGHDGNYQNGMDYSASATAAKTQFVGDWNAIAGQYGLPSYREQDI